MRDELEPKAMAVADEILAEHGTAHSRERLRLILALAWTEGYGDALKVGKQITDEAFSRLAP